MPKRKIPKGMTFDQRNSNIRQKRKSGMTLESIGQPYGLTREMVRQICTGIKPKKIINRKKQPLSYKYCLKCSSCGGVKSRGAMRCGNCRARDSFKKE